MLAMLSLVGFGTDANAQNRRNRTERTQKRDAKGARQYRKARGRQNQRVRARQKRTTSRGAGLLRNAVRNGYRQGVRAGRRDRNNRRGKSYSNSSLYRRGNYGYRNYVSSSQYQYYFRQGFQRGYKDGYDRRSRYGRNNSILGTILNGILNIQH